VLEVRFDVDVLVMRNPPYISWFWSINQYSFIWCKGYIATVKRQL